MEYIDKKKNFIYFHVEDDEYYLGIHKRILYGFDSFQIMEISIGGEELTPEWGLPAYYIEYVRNRINYINYPDINYRFRKVECSKYSLIKDVKIIKKVLKYLNKGG